MPSRESFWSVCTLASPGTAIHDGRFHGNPYDRLRVVPIAIPPLRRRREEIESLARRVPARQR